MGFSEVRPPGTCSTGREVLPASPPTPAPSCTAWDLTYLRGAAPGQALSTQASPLQAAAPRAPLGPVGSTVSRQEETPEREVPASLEVDSGISEKGNRVPVSWGRAGSGRTDPLRPRILNPWGGEQPGESKTWSPRSQGRTGYDDQIW